MARLFRWMRAASLAGAVLSIASMAVGSQLEYPRPCPNGCAPNAKNWGYFQTKWRQWPGQSLPERNNPRAVDAAVIPTPPGYEEILPPKATPQQPPSLPVPSPQEKLAPPPALPGGEILPPEGLLIPEPPSAEAPKESPPGGSSGLLLPGLPPEPGETAPPPKDQPLRPSGESKPGESPRPEAPAAPSENKQSMLRSPVAPPVANRFGGGQPSAAISTAAQTAQSSGIVSPVAGVEPGQNTVPPGVHRADPIAPAAPEWSPDRAKPTSHATTVKPGETAKAAAKAAVPSVALGGYCPVELTRNGRWVSGDLRWTAVHNGRIYRFAGEWQRQQFLSDPGRFAPVHAGNDPVLLADIGREVPGKPAYCAMYDGHLYMFFDAATQSQFNRAPQRYAVK